ncbi:hypothetical protein [Pseudomonas phage PPpW-3]|uniref:Uncharacterized protein n=1 Tax=Pseudomonas phage PPpW-3 TaxID=1279082 RepID=V5YTD7_9CAUD|nr:hypothetical protein X916_gp42 [Pseudomonas phage PPpW-3]BAO20642.1 hypothetical protein [Pseudomonas phage PPpW-3]
MNAGEFAARRARINNEAWRRSPAFAKRALARLVREARAADMRSECGKHLGWKLPNGQVVCRKEAFRTQEDADQALARIAAHLERNQNNKVPTRTYQCPCCKNWHLTSQQPLH